MNVRIECLQPASVWEKPSKEEIREVIKRAGFTGAQAAAFVGLKPEAGGRNVRRWTGGQTEIPYSAWALLCAKAGFGNIWEG